jgi:hypothetical protein
VVPYENVRGPSEYERLISRLAPLRGSVELAQITDADVAFLFGETRIPAARIQFLINASRRSTDRTPLSDDSFVAAWQRPAYWLRFQPVALRASG